jgi:hypothetical protein
MLPRNLTLLLVGLAIAALTLFVSWRLGFVFFLLPLFFFWSWGGGRRQMSDADEDLHEIDPDEDRRENDRRAHGADERGPGACPPAAPGLDGEGI